MSRKGHHNFFSRAHKTDACVRAIVTERNVARLHDDIGEEPISASDAYDLGREGGHVVWLGPRACRRMGIRAHYRPYGCSATLDPALPTDAIRPYDAGLAVLGTGDDWVDGAHQDWLERQAELEWDEATPAESIHKAWFELENRQWIERWEQEERAWEQHQGVAEDQVPTFLVRVPEPISVRGSW